MEPNSLANIEAAFNICANASEIVGVRYGLGLLLLSMLFAFSKKWKSSRKHFFIGLGTFILGVAMPGLLNWLVASLRDSHEWTAMTIIAVMAGIVGAIIIGAGVGLIFLPVFIARKRHAKHFRWIVALCVLSLVIFIPWSIALFLALKDDIPTSDTTFGAGTA